VGCQPRRAERGLTGRVPGMVFWGDLYDDFLDHSGLRSGNDAGGVVRFLVCGRRWEWAVVGTSRPGAGVVIVRERRSWIAGGVAVALVCGGE
jgi:hypothetical protein